MSNEVKLLTDWLRANKHSLNESIAKLLIFRPRRKLNIAVPNIKLNNFILTLEKPVTYLGTENDENLSWKEQIEILAKKLSRKKQYFVKVKVRLSPSKKMRYLMENAFYLILKALFVLKIFKFLS